MTRAEEDRDHGAELDRSARLELIYRIVSAISHDFNNVLATTSMYAELLLQDPAVEGVTAEDVREILDAARRGAALTAFLAVLKDSRGVSTEPALVGVQLGHVQKVLGRLLPDGVRIEVGVPTGDLEVRIDRVRLQQAVFATVWSLGEALAGSGGIIRVGVASDERTVTIDVRGAVEGEGEASNDEMDGGVPVLPDDLVISETRTVLEAFGGGLEVAGEQDAAGGYRLVLPRTGAGTSSENGDTNGSDAHVLVVGDPALERLLAGEGLRTTRVTTPDEAVPHATAADVIVGPASRAMFRATGRIRSEGIDARVLLLGTAVDVELPPALELDPHVRLVWAPVSGDRLAELIRHGPNATG
ncbi:MAG TPA: hypothetical protein VJ925_09845 [Longimicrobiales bacterium]|nr:hypothetical protein [Longimicrobiales bacterium]